MTKEKLLKEYLSDDVFTNNGYLKEGKAEDFSWTDGRGVPIIEALKTIIKEDRNGKGNTTIVRLTNKVLDSSL